MHAIIRTDCQPPKCEAWLYANGLGDCRDNAVYTLINTDTIGSDPDYPEGFHVAHLCANHATMVLDKSEGKE